MNCYVKSLTIALLTLYIGTQTAMAADELRFSWWGGDSRHKPTLEAIKLFESKHPGVKVRGEYMGWDGYEERLTTQLSAGSEPDVMQVNWASISTMFSKNGDGFYDLYKAKSVLSLNEWGTAIQSGVWKGKLNAIPVAFTARVYLWQKSVFDKAGIAIPSTWDELFSTGKAFEQKLGKDYYPVDGQLYDVIMIAHAYMYQKTGKQWIDPSAPVVAYSKAETLEFIQFYKKLAETHVVVPLQARLSISGPEAPTEQQQEWVTGKWAGNYTWDSTFTTRLSPLPKTTSTDIGPFLTLKSAKNSGFYGRPSLLLAVSKKCKKPLLAAELINFLTTDPSAIKVLGTSRGIPLTKIGLATLQKEKKITVLDEKAQAQFKKTVINVPSAYLEHAKIQSLLKSIFEEVSLGKISDAQAVERLTTETNKVLNAIK
jgi:oligogalacturonide transport system substrate-binding protein